MNKLTCFELNIDQHIAHLVLNRPDRLNALDMTVWRELDEVLQQLHQSNQARVLVISSTGKHFSAGMSLEAFGNSVSMDDQSAEGRAAIFDMLSGLQSTFTRLETLRIPVIVAIQGGCIGGAVDMVTAACLRYASADAFFCIQEINIGMVADVGTLQRLPKLIPMAVVKELAYTGRRMSADKALQYGLVNEVLPDAHAALAAAMKAAEDIASKPPVAVWGTKQALHYARDHSVEDSLKQMGWLQSGIWSNAHVGEAITAFQKKQVAEFPELATLRSFKDVA
ncbi:MAG: enoyl-CoA hydratase/isomerase family protein [Methylotenera sp.]|nr:enoyl-CoA hydratase/isomerase family protein [Methylotenera sp.]